jgi:hypothetical protein
VVEENGRPAYANRMNGSVKREGMSLETATDSAHSDVETDAQAGRSGNGIDSTEVTSSLA